ncbi:MAG TPA: sensor histidine kinase, partial [Puia sp.]
MLNTQNLTPKQLSAFTALIISTSVATGIFILTSNWKFLLGFFLLLFSGTYLLIQFILEKFINRKIKLIYKFIHQTKATRKEEVYFKYILPKKSLDEVGEDVERWGNKQI